MARVLTFSRTFPSDHPKAGQPTFFVPAIWQSLYNQKFMFQSELMDDYSTFNSHKDFYAKHHTIRAGNRWKVGDWFSPRVWSGKPRRSKQIVIAPDIQVKKVWNIRINLVDQYENIYIISIEEGIKTVDTKLLASNDGLTEQDFYDWFDTPKNRKKIFKGQIICWNENINY